MKRTLAFSVLLACSGALLGNSPNTGSRTPATLLEDLVRLTRAGSSNVTVLAYAKAHRLELPPEVSDSDLRWLRDSGVSEAVVRYMTAIDVRPSDEIAQADVASSSYEGTHASASYSHAGSGDDGYGESYPDRYSGNYPDSSYDLSAGYDDASYGPGYYPFYPYYPYTAYFFVDRNGFSHRFHRRDPRVGGHRGIDGGRGFRGHRGDVVGRGGSGNAWRERGFNQPRRPTFARGGASLQGGAHGRAIGPRGFGPSGAARGSSPHVFRGPPGGISGHGGFSHPGFSGGPHTGGNSGHSSRGATGRSGGRGR